MIIKLSIYCTIKLKQGHDKVKADDGSIATIPQTVLALGVLTVLLRALERCLDPVALPASIFPCNLSYLVAPTLK